MLLLLWCALHVGALAQTTLPIAQWVQNKQKEGLTFNNYQPLQFECTDLDPRTASVLSKGSILQLDENKLNKLYTKNEAAILLQLPINENENLTLKLIQQAPYSEEFVVKTESRPDQFYVYEPARHYRGIVEGLPHSLAAVSIFQNSLMGMISIQGIGNFVLGKIEDPGRSEYLLYNDQDVTEVPPFDCGALEVPGAAHDHSSYNPTENLEKVVVDNCVKVYLECDYDLFQEKGSVQNAVDFMTGLYNVVAVLYQNESISTEISEIFVWDSPDSYSTSSTSAALNSFRAYRTNYNGDLAHLVSRGAPTGGGVAWLDVLCSSYGYAYSYIYSDYQTMPTYSWSVNVLTHEMGHNLGSPHTHSCDWTINGVPNQAIDGCANQAGIPAGPCQQGPIPSSGTIMSYCHLLNNVGVDMTLGFGPLPGDLIRNRVNAASCLDECSGSGGGGGGGNGGGGGGGGGNGCDDILANMSKSNIQCNGDNNGMASVNPSGGTPPYSFQWSNGATNATITNLGAGQYSVTITDTDNCTIEESVTINEPAAINISLVATPEAVPGANNGSIQANVSGGFSPYQYSWSNGSNLSSISNLSAGNYTLTITDAGGCQQTASVAVGDDGCAAQVTVFPFEEGFEVSQMQWNQMQGDDLNWKRQSGGTPTNGTGPGAAFEGSYYMFTEANGAINGTAILQTPCLDLTAVVDPELNLSYHMYGADMGSLKVEVSKDNGAIWQTVFNKNGNQGNQWYSTSIDLSAFQTPYTLIRIVGNVGNGPASDIAIDALTLTGTCASPDLHFTLNPVTCNGFSTGSIAVVPNGGMPPYTYEWSNGATGHFLNNLSAGTYTVWVTDDLGCFSEETVVLEDPDVLEYEAEVYPVTVPGASDGAILLNVTGGEPGYQIEWSNGIFNTHLNNIDVGTYGFTIKDNLGCEVNGNVEVEYLCNPLKALPMTEGFETGLDDWMQLDIDGFDWIRHSGSTPTPNTGPTSASQGDFYLYAEADDNEFQIGILQSPCFDLTTVDIPMIYFDYHMFGADVAQLQLRISEDAGANWIQVFNVDGAQGPDWNTAAIDLTPYLGKVVTFLFVAKIGGEYGDIAIDGFEVMDMSSPTTDTDDFGDLDPPAVLLFPNPATDYLNIVLEQAMPESLQLQVVDAMGRVLMTREEVFAGSNLQEQIELDQLPAGVYWMRLFSGTSELVERFVIQR